MKQKQLLMNLKTPAMLLGVFIAIWLLIPVTPVQQSSTDNINNLVGDAAKGADLLSIAGCFACHTDADNGMADFSGGPALDSPFGTFYGSNITPDIDTGIGAWSLNDFERAVRQGISPDKKMYYPAMPFTSYNGLTDQDVVDLWAGIQALKPVSNESLKHDLSFPFNQRILLKPWRILYFPTFDTQPESRGEYLVKHVLHCGECHTPRDILGGQRLSKYLQGNPNLPDDNFAPDISKQKLVQLGWSADDIEILLSIGMMIDGDFVAGSMGEVVDYGTSLLSNEDVTAIRTYLSE